MPTMASEATIEAGMTVVTANPLACPVCQKAGRTYAFTIARNAFVRCQNCRSILPAERKAPPDADTEIDTEEYVGRDLRNLCDDLMDTFNERGATGPFLVISSINDAIAVPLKETLNGADFRTMPEIEKLPPANRYGTIILLTPFTFAVNPGAFLQQLAGYLVANGHLILLQPMQDSWRAHLLQQNWHEWQKPHAFYATRDTLHITLLNNGLNHVWFRRVNHHCSLEYLHGRLKQLRHGALLRMANLFISCLPPFLRRLRLKLPSGHVICSCQPAVPRLQPTLSVIVPVYNEHGTFKKSMDALLAKQVPGLRKQIVVVESNSTDGTRELVRAYENHPDVMVIYQPKPRGKGYAVREGLQAATGDYVLIQDADLEYDLNDYDALLEPLRNSQVMFVLGSRHRGNWKMREFNDAPVTAAVFNFGHVFFTWFINLLTRQSMTDPFTMFKVLRRDAFYGIDFICRRFDFDHEMVIKLVRKGYQPIELPVNYHARSFAEGKKVSFVKDGLTWVWTDLKLRYGRLGIWRD